MPNVQQKSQAKEIQKKAANLPDPLTWKSPLAKVKRM